MRSTVQQAVATSKKKKNRSSPWGESGIPKYLLFVIAVLIVAGVILRVLHVIKIH